MNLKDFLTNKDNPPELYWSLVIEKGLVQAGIWYIEDGLAKVVGIGAGLPWERDEDLIESTDAALSSAIQKIPEDYPEPQKTVFGVANSWIKDGEISPENLVKIKRLCTELSLTPVGFVVLPEAIAHLYKSEEGAPLNAIILKSGDDNLELSVFKLGSLIGNAEISRSVSLVDDVIEGLSRFGGVDPLPTRFIVYDGKEGELEETQQTLMQANWGEGKINFLHTPQIEILNTDKKVMATALAGGAEIGNTSTVVDNQEGKEELPVGETPLTENVSEEAQKEEKPLSAENLGFSVGEDVSSMKQEDIQNVMPPKVSMPVQQPVMPKERVNYLTKSKELFHSFSKLFPKTNTGNKNTNKTLIAISAVFGLLVVLVGVLWGFFQTAKVTIYVTPKRFEENTQMTFDTGGTYDTANSVLPAKVLTDKVSGEKTKSATGTKLIGNKAAGSVQIANGNSAAINLAAGTLLTSSSGFKFVTANEASVSGQLLPGSPGTATVDVAAYDIGAQYNLAKGEIFSVGNYSKALVAATSTADFGGGSSQQVSAISKEDQTNLENDLINELNQNAKSNLSAKVEENEFLVSDLAETSVTSENFDHKVGDQADSLKLSLSLNVTGLAADKNKLLDYAKGVLSGKAPEGYSLSSDQIDFKFTSTGSTDGKYSYDAVVGGNFLPYVDTAKIKNIILGKTVSVAEEYLNSVQGFGHANVVLKLKFPGFLKTIPRIAKNITIEVKPE